MSEKNNIPLELSSTDILIHDCEWLLRLNTPEKHREKFYQLFKQARKTERELSDLKASHATELDRVREVGQKLANWSRKYPRSRIYGYGSQPKMDGELIELENEAKLLFPELTNQLTKEDKDESTD